MTVIAPSDLRPIAVPRVMSADDASDLVGEPVPADLEANVTRAGLYYDAETGEPVLGYAPYPADRQALATLRRAVLEVPWSATRRASTGIQNVSRTFGTAPRLPVRRRESCRPTSLAVERPDIHIHLEHAATTLSAWLNDLLPDQIEHDRHEVASVLPEWRIGDDTVWTSGVINRTSVLPYHRDGANFKAWSAMPVFRRGTRGGFLSLPEYDLTVACRDTWTLYFPGWSVVHGVTPITKVEDDGYRISVVFYSLQGTKDCHTFAKELARGQRIRTERESHYLRDDDTDGAGDDDDSLW